MNTKTTRRPASHSYRRLRLAFLAGSIFAALAGARFLEWQEAGVAGASDLGNLERVTAATTAAQPATRLVVPDGNLGAGNVVLDLAPAPTIVAPATQAPIRPVARTRSSR